MCRRATALQAMGLAERRTWAPSQRALRACRNMVWLESPKAGGVIHVAFAHCPSIDVSVFPLPSCWKRLHDQRVYLVLWRLALEPSAHSGGETAADSTLEGAPSVTLSRAHLGAVVALLLRMLLALCINIHRLRPSTLRPSTLRPSTLRVCCVHRTAQRGRSNDERGASDKSTCPEPWR
jgi:hypothetical protein